MSCVSSSLLTLLPSYFAWGGGVVGSSRPLPRMGGGVAQKKYQPFQDMGRDASRSPGVCGGGCSSAVGTCKTTDSSPLPPFNDVKYFQTVPTTLPMHTRCFCVSNWGEGGESFHPLLQRGEGCASLGAEFAFGPSFERPKEERRRPESVIRR